MISLTQCKSYMAIVKAIANSKPVQWWRRRQALKSKAELDRRAKAGLLLLAAALTVCGGCRIMPSGALRAHVEGYNALHAGQEIELWEPNDDNAE